MTPFGTTTLANSSNRPETMHLEPCACGEFENLYPQTKQSLAHGPFAVWCENCETWGPERDSKREAMKAWNEYHDMGLSEEEYYNETQWKDRERSAW